MDENPTFEARDTHIASQAAQLTNAVAAVYPKYFNGRDNAVRSHFLCYAKVNLMKLTVCLKSVNCLKSSF